MPAEAKRRALRNFVLISLLCLIWGSTWFVIKKSLADLPPLTSVAARMTVAALVMIAIAKPMQRLEGGTAAPRWLALLLGICQFTISFSIVYWCERLLPSGLCAVLWSVYPLLIAIGGHFLLRAERLGLAKWLGFLLGFAGVYWLFQTDVKSLGPDGIPTALVLLISPLVVAYSTLMIKKHGAGVASGMLNRDALCIGSVLLWVLVALFERDAPVRWTGQAVFSVGYLALLGTVTTFGIYFWLMRTIPAWRMSLISYVTPALSLLLQVLFEDAPVATDTVVGLCAILGGTALAALGKPRTA